MLNNTSELKQVRQTGYVGKDLEGGQALAYCNG